MLFVLLIPTATWSECGCNEACKTIKAIKNIEYKLKRNSSPKAVPADKLAPVILKLAREYELEPDLITRIILLESKGEEKAYNRHTKDFGLMQINARTAKAYGLSRTCLMAWKCNLEAGIRILSDIGDGRVCRYNVGSKPLKGLRLKSCLKYERKLASIN